MGFMDNMRQQGVDGGTSSEGTEAAAAAPPSADGKKRRKRRKPEEMLASVVRESTVNAAVDLLRQNERFVLPGNNSWVALALPVAEIGGLSKKQQKDETKGSLIELINHDLIQAITTRALLDEEILGIIPTPQTLERMEEYSLLTNASYFWMVLSPNTEGTELTVTPVNDKPVTYADAVSVAHGNRSLSEYLPHVWAWTQAIDVPTGSNAPIGPASAPAHGTGPNSAPFAYNPVPPGYGTGPNPAASAYGTGPNQAAPAYGTGPNQAAPGYGTGPNPAAPGYGTGPNQAAPAYGSGPNPAAPAYGTGPNQATAQPDTGGGYGAPAPSGPSPFPGALPPEAAGGGGYTAPAADPSTGGADPLMFSEEADDVFGGETDEDLGALDAEDFRDDESGGFDEDFESFEPFEEDEEEEVGEEAAQAEEDDEDEDTATWEEYAEQHQDREFTEDDVRATIARRFLTGDLDLDVALDEFEATFETKAPAILLELEDSLTDKPTDWLGEQVHQLAKQANTELARLHRKHRGELRKLFVETMGLHAEAVMREVDEEREGSVYQRLAAAAEQEYRDLKARAPEEVSNQRSEITRRYEEDAEQRAELAAAQARQVFWDRARPEFERKIADVAPEVEQRNEERHVHQRQLVLEMRRKDAHMRMQLGATRAFQLLSERETTQHETETALLAQWNARLTRYIDDNRKQDIARAEALAAQLQLDNSIEKMQASNAQRTSELKAEHEAQARRLKTELNAVKAELERTREHAESRIRERELEWQHKADTNNQMYTGLAERTRGLTDTMHQEYANQLMAVNRANQASIEELDRANQVQRRANKILFVLMGVVALAAIGVGVIVGWWIGFNTFG